MFAQHARRHGHYARRIGQRTGCTGQIVEKAEVFFAFAQRQIDPMSSVKTGTELFPASPRSHRLDESATSYSLTSCSPALLVSASPADLHRQADDMNLSTSAPGIRDSSLDFSCRGKANYQLPGWAKSDDRSGPGRTIKLTDQIEPIYAVIDLVVTPRSGTGHQTTPSCRSSRMTRPSFPRTRIG
jgi:hypothetical protein